MKEEYLMLLRTELSFVIYIFDFEKFLVKHEFF